MIKNKFRRLLLIASCIIMVGCATTRPMAVVYSLLMCNGSPQDSIVVIGPTANTEGMYDKQWSAAIKFCTDEELYSDMCKGYYTTPYIEKILDKGRCLTYVEQLKAQGLLRQDYEYTGGSTTTTPTYTQEEIDAAWEENERKEPTCVEDGYISYKNKLTGKTSLETLPATGHEYQTDTTVDATCIEEGKITYKCSKCEDTYDELLPVTEHTRGEWVTTKEPTVFEEGENTLFCLVCGEELETEILEKDTLPLVLVAVAVVIVGIVIVIFKNKDKNQKNNKNGGMQEPYTKNEEKSANKNDKITVKDIVISVVIAGVVVGFFTCVISLGTIASASMEPTLMTGDMAVSNRLAYVIEEPKTGDIISFERENEIYGKRIIGVSGDHIQFANGYVYINGVKLDEPYIDSDLETICYQEFNVPEGHVFVLGDHRDFSLDSRFWDEPYVDVDNIVARYMFSIPFHIFL